jgi:hypothetical protein
MRRRTHEVLAFTPLRSSPLTPISKRKSACCLPGCVNWRVALQRNCGVNIRFKHTSGRAISTFVLLVEMINFVGRVLAHDSGRVGIRRTEIQTD